MGIRYYAYPVAAELVPQAREDPHLFLSDDPLMDAWGPAERRPPMLYLDKCWGPLQDLTGPRGNNEPRPAYRMFEGHVTYVDAMRGGWYAWTRVLDPDEIADIARDIVLLDDDDIRSILPSRRGFGDGDEEYLREYLQHAKEFVVDLASKGSGAVYMIG